MQIRYVMCSIIMVYAVLLLLHDVIMMMTIKVTFSLWAWVKCYTTQLTLLRFRFSQVNIITWSF